MRRIIHLIIILAILLVSGMIPNFKSEAQGVQCFGLAQADCDIMVAADANYAKQTSFQYELALSYSTNTITDKSGIELTGTGSFGIDVLPPVTDVLLFGLTAEGLNVDALKLTLNFDEKIINRNQEQTVKDNTVIVDGVIYTKDPTTEDWTGQRISDIVKQTQAALQQSGSAQLTAIVTALHDPAITDAIASFSGIKGFIKVTKTAKIPVLEGQNMVEFAYTYDLQKLFKSKEILPILRALAESNGSSVSDAQLTMTQRLLAQALNGSTLKFTRWVGSKDKYNHYYVADLVLKIGSVAGNFGLSVLQGVSLKVHFALKMTKIGQPVDVQAPEGATVAGQ